jgi:serine protease Do
MAIGLLAAPLYGQAEDNGQPQRTQAQQQRVQRGTAEQTVPEKTGRPALTDRQRSLLSDISGAVHAVAETVKDSVVHIEVADRSPRRPGGRAVPPPGDEEGDEETDGRERQQIPDDLREQLRRFFGGRLPPGMEVPDDVTPQERVRRGLGSGIVFDNKGHILTNNHVVGGAKDITVKTTDGREFSAKIIGTDPLTDVAVIRVESPDLTAAQFGDSNAVAVGDLSMAVGNPFGLDYSVTLGIISALGRNRLQLGGIYYQDFIQTDAAINPGNSGGPLINMEGQVIGLNTAIATQTGQYAGVGFSIPSNLAKRIADILIEKGKVTRGWLGVHIEDLKPGMAASFEYPRGKDGALVNYVVPDSPAARAGLKYGDIIMAINGQPVKNATQLQTSVTLTPPNEKVTFQVWRYDDSKREGKTIDLQVTLGELKERYLREMGGPGGPGAAPGTPERIENAELGLTTTTPTAEQAKTFGWTEIPKGAMVVQVEPAGEAARLDIRPGDVIVSVQGQNIETASDLEEALKKVSVSEGFRLYVLSSPKRGGVGRYVYVQRG